MNHIECSAHYPQDTLDTVYMLWIHRWYSVSKSFESLDISDDLLPRMPLSREETDVELFSEKLKWRQYNWPFFTISVLNRKKQFILIRVRFLTAVRELRPCSFPRRRTEDWIRKNGGNHIVCDRKELSTTQPETLCFSVKHVNISVY